MLNDRVGSVRNSGFDALLVRKSLHFHIRLKESPLSLRSGKSDAKTDPCLIKATFWAFKA